VDHEEGLAFDPTRVEYSGATAPGSHRLPNFAIPFKDTEGSPTLSMRAGGRLRNFGSTLTGFGWGNWLSSQKSLLSRWEHQNGGALVALGADAAYGDQAMANDRIACQRCGCELDFSPSTETQCWCAKEAFRVPMPLPREAGDVRGCLCPSCLRLAARAPLQRNSAPRAKSS
jgi:hypothetical protein